jgi:glutathione synthase/RimK-type ligase-like ATP-grasp enzyme
VQSLGRLGHEVYLFDPDPDPALAHSRYCRGHLRSPSEYSSPDYAQWLMRTVSSGDYDLLIPISDRVVDVVSHYRDKLSEHIALALPEPKHVELARDKARTAKYAMSHGELVPPSYFPENMAAVRELIPALSYPVVVKLPRGTAGHGVFVVHDAAAVVDCFERHGRPDNWPFIQDFVPGDIADVAAVCDHGEMVTYFSFYAELKHLVGGTPPYVRSLADPALVDMAGRLVRQLGWHGAIDFDFVRAASGDYYLLEINPRFSGTTNFAYKLGIDLPRSYLDVVLGRPSRAHQRSYQDGWLFRTVFPAEVDWWRRDKVRRTATVARAGLRPRTRSNIYWRDWRLIRAQAREAIRNRRR